MKTLILLFLVCFAGTQDLQAQAKDTSWLRQNTWAFENFDDTNVSWNIFRQTFIGVAPSPSGDFDLVFYNDLYKNTLFNPGNCFGMDVLEMLIMEDGGYAGYCHPPGMYAILPDTVRGGPLDPALHQAINIAHGNQITEGFISFVIDVFSTDKFRDGNYVFDMVNQYLAQGDQPVISIAPTISPSGGGHVLVPYYEDTLDANTRRIFCYNPNRSIFTSPYNPDHLDYTNGTNFITIKSDGTWSYDFNYPPKPLWTGNPSSGGLIMAIPLSVAGRKDRLPQSLFADATKAISTIFIFGKDVRVRQITNLRNGRRFFNAQGTDPEQDPRKRFKTVAPFIPMGGSLHPETGGPAAVYFVRGGDPFQVAVQAKGKYKIKIIADGQYMEREGTGDGDVRVFRAPTRRRQQTAPRLRPEARPVHAGTSPFPVETSRAFRD